ncbi:MAG: alpha/beta fold hydrolase [Acetobacteraceae bacterium]|nr:alpha/beta fold hydrolase [Acetobacteraceae bacterium]
MILHTHSIGEGPPAIILHGLFGTASNFATIQKRLATGRRVLTMDLRNHGRSAHDPVVDYATMADDVLATMASLGFERAALVGHSMGGKVAMTAAFRHGGRITRLLVADIAPVPYPPRYRAIADAMLSLPLEPGLTRAAADAELSSAVPDQEVRQFLLSNLRFGATPSWRIGLAEIAAALPAIEGWDGEGRYDGPTLVLRGERSDYIKPEDRPLFRALFPAARFTTLRDAGHWLHADAPDAFVATLDAFLPHTRA